MTDTAVAHRPAVDAFNAALLSAVQRALVDVQQVEQSTLLKLIDIPKTTLYRLCRDARDPFPAPRKEGGRLFWNLAEVRDWSGRRHRKRFVDDPLETLAREV